MLTGSVAARPRPSTRAPGSASRCVSEGSQLLLAEVEFLHYLVAGFSRLIGLTKDEVLGVQVAHVANLGLARDQK